MNIVTLDGCTMCEGKEDEDCDFHLDKYGHPIFHEGTRIHHNSVVQFWNFTSAEHRVYIARRSTEGQIRLEWKETPNDPK